MALHGYGGLTFAAACKVLIYEFSKLYPDWDTLAKTMSVFCMCQACHQRGFSLHSGIQTALHSGLEEE